MSGRSRRHLATTTASSMAMDAPCPEEGAVACAASPMTIIDPLVQVGTEGRSYVAQPASFPGVEPMISTAGVASPAKRSTNIFFHCSVLIAASSALVGSSARGGLANHHTSPEG